MNTPKKIEARFANRLNALKKHHDELGLAIYNKMNQAKLESQLTAQFVLQATILWESFLSDMILAYIEMYPKRALSSLQERIKTSVEAKFGKSARRALKFTPPKNPTRPVIEGLVDPKGWNLTSANASSLASKASELLPATAAKRFALNRADSEFYDYAVCLRNYLSHYSTGSRLALQAAANALSDPENSPLKGTIGNIDGYLKRNGGTGIPRSVVVVNRMLDIAKEL